MGFRKELPRCLVKPTLEGVWEISRDRCVPVFVRVRIFVCWEGREDMRRVSCAGNMCGKAGRQAGRSLQGGLGGAGALVGPGVEVDGKPHQQGL